jgi:hypothetical protein
MAPQLNPLPGLSNEEYHQLPAVSPSGLKLLNRSPLHYYDRFLAPDREPSVPTAAMALGTALHLAVLEPATLTARVAVAPTCDRRTKAGKESWAEFEQRAAGRLVISRDDGDRVLAMAAAVRKHPAAQLLLNMPGKAEQSYTWTDEATGVACKCRPDWHSDDHAIVVDVKTTQDASREAFSKSIANFDYHLQAAWNRRALDAEQFIIIAVESARPYAVAVFTVSGALLAAGERRIDAALERLAECQASNEWPGYGDLVLDPIDLPGWCRD